MSIRKLPPMCWQFPETTTPTFAELVDADPQLAVDVMAAATQAARQAGLDDGYRIVFNTGPNSGQTVPRACSRVGWATTDLAAGLMPLRFTSTVHKPEHMHLTVGRKAVLRNDKDL